MARVVIDGEKFLLILGLEDTPNLSPETIAEALRRLDKEELDKLEVECLRFEDTLPHLNPEIFMHLHDSTEFIPSKYKEPEYTESELRRMIKYEKNPMRKTMLQRELSTMNMWNGKHSKGRK